MVLFNPENVVKSRIAQSIVEEMFRYSGYQVYRFGYESVLRNLLQTSEKPDKDDEFSKVVARMPDLLVVKDNLPNFIEVKFRKDGNLTRNEVISWHEGRIILVFPFPPYFKISRIEEFVRTGKLYELDKDHFIPVDKRIINLFIPLVEKYFKEKSD